jgi:hypothetical protein
MENLGGENSIYDVKWGAHTLDTFSPFVFIFRLLDFRFLCMEAPKTIISARQERKPVRDLSRKKEKCLKRYHKTSVCQYPI